MEALKKSSRHGLCALIEKNHARTFRVDEEKQHTMCDARIRSTAMLDSSAAGSVEHGCEEEAIGSQQPAKKQFRQGKGKGHFVMSRKNGLE